MVMSSEAVTATAGVEHVKEKRQPSGGGGGGVRSRTKRAKKDTDRSIDWCTGVSGLDDAATGATRHQGYQQLKQKRRWYKSIAWVDCDAIC
jgi:hypothetical protein